MAKRKAAKRKKATTRRRLASTSRRRTTKRRNPHGRVIGDAALKLSYEGGEGKRKGKMRGPWVHEFEQGDVQVIGERDGSIRLRSKSGVRLWDVFEV